MGIVNEGDKVVLDGCEVCDWDAMREAYRKRIETYGISDHRSLFYSDAALYRGRIERAGAVAGPLVRPGDTVLDVGCGDGNLLPLLPPCRYTGVDVVPEFVERARERFPRAEFRCANVMDEDTAFDWVLLVGTTGTTPGVERIIEHCWGLAKKGMVLDILDARRDPGGDRNSMHAGATVDFFLERGAARVVVEPTRDPWTFFVVSKGLC